MFAKLAVTSSGLIGLPVAFSMPAATTLSASVGEALMKSIGVTEAGDQLLDDVGVGVEELGRDEQVGGDVLAVRPQVLLVDEDLAAAFVARGGSPTARAPRRRRSDRP